MLMRKIALQHYKQ